jgi:hypothetical protein
MNNSISCVHAFDQWPNEIGTCFIRDDNGEYEVVLRVGCVEGSIETVIVKADRDQWGVRFTAGTVQVATEDGTKSFLDGLIKCLQELRKITEFETREATKEEGAV